MTVPLSAEFCAFLRCPACVTDGDLIPDGDGLRCRRCGCAFPIAHGRVDFLPQKGIFPVAPDAQRQDGGHIAHRHGIARAVIPRADINLAQKRVLQMLGRQLAKHDNPIVLVVSCGKQAAILRSYLSAAADLQLVLTDVNPDSDAEWLCDAHRLPFADGTIDAVITTAVLEHVARPAEAVSEIHRVLKVGGLVYSEVPFMSRSTKGPMTSPAIR